MTEIESQLSERRRQWAEMAPAQQMQRIQHALLGTLDLARWRRTERRRRLAAQVAAQPQKVVRYDPL